MIKKHKPYPPYWWGFAALSAGLVATLIVWWFSFAGTYWRLWNGQILEMRPWPALFCLRPWNVLTCHGIFESAGYPDMMKIYRRQVSVFLPTILGFAALFGTWYYRNKPRRLYIEDGPAIGNRDDLREACRLDCKEGGGPGLQWFDPLTLSRRREANNFICIGAPGSGKTQLINQLCRSAVQRGDQLFVYCHKPEMISEYPKQFNEAGKLVHPIILAPHDIRSWAWDPSIDVTGPESARAIADLIVNLDRNDSSFFADTSRVVVTMYIAKLHAISPRKWSWDDLAAQVEQPYEQMVDDAKMYYTPAVQLLQSEKRQLDSIRSSVQVALENLRLLGVAWPRSKEGDERPRFSIKTFIEGGYQGRSVLLGRSGDFPQMSDMWIVLFLSLAQQVASGSSIAASDDRRVWFILDEFARLPRIKAISDLMVTGRDRGFPILLGLQNPRQVAETYGPNEFDTWWSSVQTKIIFRSMAGDTTRWLVENLGKTRVVEYKLEKNPDGTTDTKGKPPRTDPAFDVSDFEHLLGVRDKKGIDVFVTGIGKDRYLVRAPFYEGVPHPVFRPRYEPAEWITQPRQPSDDLPKAMPIEAVKRDIPSGQAAAADGTPPPASPQTSSHLQPVGQQGKGAALPNAEAVTSVPPVPTEYSAENIEVLKALTPAKRRSRLHTSDPVEDDSEVSEDYDELERKAAKGG